MSSRNGNKSNKRLIAVIAVLTAVIIVLTAVIVLGGRKKEKNDNIRADISTEAQITGEVSDTSADIDIETDDGTEQEASDTKTSDCYVTVSISNSWETGDKFSAQLDAQITNNSSSAIKDWEIKIEAPSGTTVDSSWNGNCELKNGILIITPVEYNSEVGASASVGGIGFIVTVPSQADMEALTENSVLYIDGKEYSGNSGVASQNNNTEKDDRQETEKAEANKPAEPESGTPFDNHGRLSVKGTDIVDKNGEKYQLKGVSTHGIAWFPDYVNKDAFATFRDDWNANLIRIAMYTDEYGGYCNGGDRQQLKNLVDTGVQAATELGMYVIVDWHILKDCNPQTNKEEAKAFFKEMSEKYKNYDNVIYEICNEPNGGTTWADVKAYAEELIPVIRENDKEAIIIVGTPNWSQDVDIASNNPIKGYDNIMYAVHFYAATHTDNIRSKVETALDNGLPVFVSEFSICDASGNGAIDYNQADKWFELINNNNLSYSGWNVSNKDETSSLIKSSCTKLSGWTEDDLSETGIWLRNQIKGN